MTGIIASLQAKKELVRGADAYLVHLLLKLREHKEVQGYQ